MSLLPEGVTVLPKVSDDKVGREGKWEHGKTVVDGKIRYWSASSLSTGDPNESGCLRKWWYERVMGRKRPPTAAAIRGTELHAEIATYLLGGPRPISPLAVKGMHMVLPPGADLIVEHDILIAPGATVPSLDAAPLRLLDIPVLGFLDLAHSRGTCQGADDAREAFDPEGTVEVRDWKSTGGTKYLKKAADLPKTIQMCLYGSWVYAVRPHTTQVRLSHGYFVVKGRSQLRTIRVGREEISRGWEHAEGVARSIVHVAKETNAELVPANTDACDAFGGCPHREICSGPSTKTLSQIIGKRAAENLMARGNPPELNMSLLNSVAIPGAAALQTAPSAAGSMLGNMFAAAAPPAGPSAAEIEAERAKIKAEADEAARLRAIPPGFAEACLAVEEFGAGMPPFSGAAAAAFAAIMRTTIDGAGCAGTGKLGKVKPIADPAMMPTLIAELTNAKLVREPANRGAVHAALSGTRTIPGVPAVAAPAPVVALAPPNPDPVGILPPDAPASNPMLAVDPIVASPVPADVTMMFGTPAPQLTATITIPPPTPAQVAAREIGPITVSVPAAAITAAAATTPAATAPATRKKRAPKTPATGTALTLYLDCSPDGDAESLDEYVDALVAKIAAEPSFAVPHGDPRLCTEGPCSYSKWRPLLGAMARETPPPPGVYVVDGRGNDFGEVVAMALRPLCRASGGEFVRGYR